MTWLENAAATWGFDHVYVFLWNTTGDRAEAGRMIGLIQPVPDYGSRIVNRPDRTATWHIPEGELLWARGAIATLPDGTVLWLSSFEPIAAGDRGVLTVVLPDRFWESYDLAHTRAPDAHGNTLEAR